MVCVEEAVRSPSLAQAVGQEVRDAETDAEQKAEVQGGAQTVVHAAEDLEPSPMESMEEPCVLR